MVQFCWSDHPDSCPQPWFARARAISLKVSIAGCLCLGIAVDTFEAAMVDFQLHACSRHTWSSRERILTEALLLMVLERRVSVLSALIVLVMYPQNRL